MEFVCKKNCGLCCGPVLIKKEIWEKHKSKLKDKIEFEIIDGCVIPLTLVCPFLDSNKKCMIYKDRPKVCRDFGLIDDLLCPYIKKNGKKRSEAKTKQLLRQGAKKVDYFLNNKMV